MRASTRRWLVAGGLLLVLALAGASAAAAHTTHVEVDPQVAVDGSVALEGLFAASEGWVVLHELDDDGEPAEAVDRRALDPDAGFRTDVALRLPDDRWANVTDARRLAAAIHTDDGDGRYEPDEDPIAESFGQRALDRFTLARGEARASVHALTFAPTTVSDGSVPVRLAELPAAGHVAVANASDGERGRVLGTLALDAGAHRNVSVPVDASALPPPGRSTSLFATIHLDDGDGDVDADDPPLQAGDELVRTRFAAERADATGNGSAPANDTDGGSRGAPGPGAAAALLALAGPALAAAARNA